MSDEDSDQTLINYSTESAISQVLDGNETAFVNYITDFSVQYGAAVRNDYTLFVDAFRNKQFPVWVEVVEAVNMSGWRLVNLKKRLNLFTNNKSVGTIWNRTDALSFKKVGKAFTPPIFREMRNG